jgi:7-carboxy-7-deazaguanine synthase
VTSYLVNEMYRCLQGEGPNSGKPSLLVRFQICNLRCTWCDTPYTHTLKSDPVDFSNPMGAQKFQRYGLEELMEAIQSLTPTSRHVILTGGEPTLQNLAPLFEGLGRTHTFEVESNGTTIPHTKHSSFLESHYKTTQWNISPKGKNAGEKWDAESLHHWSLLSHKQENVFFKFVVRFNQRNEDLAEIQLFEDTFLPAKGRIIVMPEGTELTSQCHTDWLADVCLEKNYRLSLRLHVLLFGPQRGV